MKILQLDCTNMVVLWNQLTYLLSAKDAFHFLTCV